MRGSSTTDGRLSWSTLALKRPGLSRDLPHADPKLTWVANTVTLISGRRDAVLVDTFLTRDQSQTLVDWVVSSGKNLIGIYVTHGHGDHFFGLAPLLERFPQARALATPAVVSAMQNQLRPESIDGFWRKLFPGQILDRLLVAEPLDADHFELEGEQLVSVDTGHTDTATSSSLYVPSLDLIVAGDVVYNGIHPYLAETTTQSRLDWIGALDKLETLKPRVVVAGHKVPENDDDPSHIESTRQYLRDFNRLDQMTTSAIELYEAMLARYTDRANPGSLWGGANAAKNTAGLRR
jgi:glyoxylase-like metal-dependent hydrolase (beta-lactamase superfamily II)